MAFDSVYNLFCLSLARGRLVMSGLDRVGLGQGSRWDGKVLGPIVDVKKDKVDQGF